MPNATRQFMENAWKTVMGISCLTVIAAAVSRPKLARLVLPNRMIERGKKWRHNHSKTTPRGDFGVPDNNLRSAIMTKWDVFENNY